MSLYTFRRIFFANLVLWQEKLETIKESALEPFKFKDESVQDKVTRVLQDKIVFLFKDQVNQVA